MKLNGDQVFELLKMEYQSCHDGYNSRDMIAEDEFAKFIQIFSIFLTVLLAVNIFVKVHPLIHVILCIFIGFAGFIAMIALLIDMASASSCKVALRKRCIEIENILKEDENILHFWDELEKRPKFKVEEAFKGERGRKCDREEQEGTLFVRSAILLIVVWVGIDILMAIFGQSVQLTAK